MKKLSFVVPTLVLAVAMMGAGYASWSQAINVSNTIKTGTFNFAFQTPVITADNNVDVSANPLISTTNKPDDTLAITIKNAYPSAQATITETIKNNSTITAEMTLTHDTDPNFTVVSTTVNSTAYNGPVTLTKGQDAAVVYVLEAKDDIPFSAPGAEPTAYTCSLKADFAQAAQ